MKADLLNVPNVPIGIVADSHGNDDLLLRAIKILKSSGAGVLIHLGDMCDSQAPDHAEETFSLLAEHEVMGVRGNNECAVLHDARSARGEDARLRLIPLLNDLPYTIRMERFWFAHSAPLNYPAATKRPVFDFLPVLIDAGAFPFSLLFRGHSHRPSILKIHGRSSEEIPVPADQGMILDRSGRYIITAGAVERGSCALFLPEEYEIRFITVPGKGRRTLLHGA